MALDDFPVAYSQKREGLILDIVQNQQARVTINWVPLKVTHKSYNAVFYVLNDALKIDGIRINITSETEQKIADFYGAMLLTAKLSDLVWHKADIRLVPFPRAITSSTAAMIEHSEKIDKALTGKEITNKLISTVGKDWVVDNDMAVKHGRSCNHGWHFAGGSSFRGIKGNINPSLLKDPKTNQYWYMIQMRGFAHDHKHTDYSQVCRLVTRECDVNGKRMDIHKVLQDPDMCHLANHNGVLKVLRIPTVPESNVTLVI